MAYKKLLKDFRRPKKIVFETDKLDVNYGCFSAGPFERGFGITIANALRRTLYSSILGYAITAIKIKYRDSKDDNLVLLSNEFESIHGVYEDTIKLIQNLKQVRLSLADDVESKVISFEKKGESVLTASDLQVDPVVNIANPDFYIATLNEDAFLSVELQVNMGRGYVSAERNKDCIEEIGVLPIDAIFSPVTRVNFSVEDIRIGQRTDYDKFILELWTDGTVKPDYLIGQAAKILKECFSLFINFEEEEMEEEENQDPEEEMLRNLLSTRVEELELSVRSSNCLRVVGIQTIGDLVIKSEEEMSKIKNLGKKSTTEIANKLMELQLNFGMKHLVHLVKK